MNRPFCCDKEMRKDGYTDAGKRQRYKCIHCGKRTTGTGESSNPIHHRDDGVNLGYDEKKAAERHGVLTEKIKNGLKRLVITSAQDTTPKNNKFFLALLNYCKHNDAELIIIPVHYKNISLYTGSQEYLKKWDTELNPFLIDKPLKFGNLIVQADIKMAATMINPLVGKEPIGGKQWTIFGHAQFAMETIPDMKRPKRMYTTGSITHKNYSRTNAGAKAEFHHVIGALVVELDGKRNFVRQLNADSNGGFYDLNRYYMHDRTRKVKNISALIVGDEHEKFHSKNVRKATYDNRDSIVNTLQPLNIVRHDVLDGYAGSHHHEKDDVLLYKKHHQGDSDYKKELDRVVGFINETTPNYSTSIIVASNHHDHLYKWLARVDPKKDHVNALLIHELKTLQYENAIKAKSIYDVDPFRLYVSPRLKCKHVFLNRSQEYIIKGIDVGQHGDIGPNGSRGSAASLSKGTHKMVIGHSHSARIVKGVYQVGTSTDRLSYAVGLSSWTNTHCVIYPNGKRTMIDIFNGKWRL